MKATETKLLSFLKKSPQFVIPIYQRTYSWTEKQCMQLWDDIVRAGSSDDISVHFIGSIVYIEEGLSNNTMQSPQLVIDGQQRLTTVSLLLAALAEYVGDDEPFDGFSARKIRNYYLLNPEETGDRHYKLMLSQTDNASLKALLTGSEQPENASLRVTENFDLFNNLLKKSDDKIKEICSGIAKLVVIDIALNRDQDNPQLIFESMNSTGRELSQADLIRNYVLMGLEPKFQTKLYEQYWRPMELEFGQTAYNSLFDGFMRNFLTVRTGEIPRYDEIYDDFKKYASSIGANGDGVEPLVEDIRKFARYYCSMALGKESDQELNLAFKDLRELKVDVAYPFLLELYDDYESDLLSGTDFLVATRLVEAYVFRRAVCSIPTNSLNKTLATFTKSLDKKKYLESIKAHFMILPSYRRFPSDEEFRREVQVRDLYNFRSRSYWLRRLENFERKEVVVLDEYTIEHIMPQNKALSEQWRTDLGDEWKRVHESLLHTLGNLTLTRYNSEFSDNPFTKKRDTKGGFKVSPLN